VNTSAKRKPHPKLSLVDGQVVRSDWQSDVVEEKITVLIADDDYYSRCGVRYILGGMENLEVIAEASTGKQAVELARKLQPHVVVMKVDLPELDGIAATQLIRTDKGNTRVLILSNLDDDATVRQAFNAGANGYCLKDQSSNRLPMAVLTVSNGAGWIDPMISKRFLRREVAEARVAQIAPVDLSLSERETEVLRLVAQGLSNQEIARTLFVSPETIKTHVKHIMEKLSVNDRTSAVVRAIRKGLAL
jgi:DNA-binding NarL/FixJ family response regulator